LVSSVKDALLVNRNSEAGTYTLDSISHSAAQTQRLGMRLGELLRGGELILLHGQLGTGKTTFTQGLAQGMGITEYVNSPTFTLLKEYTGSRLPENHEKRNSRAAQTPRSTRPSHSTRSGPPLYHFDLYRLDRPEEILDLGFDEYFTSNGVCVVEWAEKADLYWPTDHLSIRLRMLSETKRSLFFTASGSRYDELLRQFQKNAYATTGS
jgi:tRNA threonylcarbamoyladenosine biosynthesis protein TsaE